MLCLEIAKKTGPMYAHLWIYLNSPFFNLITLHDTGGMGIFLRGMCIMKENTIYIYIYFIYIYIYMYIYIYNIYMKTWYNFFFWFYKIFVADEGIYPYFSDWPKILSFLRVALYTFFPSRQTHGVVSTSYKRWNDFMWSHTSPTRRYKNVQEISVGYVKNCD